jgi:hypothetical protein
MCEQKNFFASRVCKWNGGNTEIFWGVFEYPESTIRIPEAHILKMSTFYD